MKTTINFKAVHQATRAMMEGNKKQGFNVSYQATMKLVFVLIKENRLNEIDKTVKVSTLEALGYIAPKQTPIKEEKAIKQATVKTEKAPKQAKKAAKKAEPVTVETFTVSYYGVPSNIIDRFNAEQIQVIENIVKSWLHFNNLRKIKVKDENGKDKFITVYDVVTVTLDNKHKFEDGMNALSTIESFKELQAVMVTYFLERQVKSLIWKALDLGVNYKKIADNKDFDTVQADNSWMNSSSNNGKVTSFEIQEVFNELIADAYTYTFSKAMFDQDTHVMPSIGFRILNVMRRMVTELRNQTKVYTIMKGYFQEVGASVSTETESLNIAKEMGVFTEKELEVIQYRINGYQKKEVDNMKGQRLDRQYKRIEKKYQDFQVALQLA